MKSINFISTIGLIMSSVMLYAFLFFSLKGPSVYAEYVLYGVFSIYFISYLLSLIEIKTKLLRILVFVLCFIGLVNSGIYSVLFMLSKVYYPQLMTIRLCYLDLAFFIFLTFKWNKLK